MVKSRVRRKQPLRSIVSKRRETATLQTSRFETSLVTPDELRETDRRQWTALASQRIEAAPFMDPDWLLSYIQSDPSTLVEAVVACENNRLVGLAPLEVHHERWSGRPVRVARSTTVDWLNRFEFLADASREEVLRGLWRHWLTSGKCDVVLLDIVPASSPTLKAALDVAAELGWKRVVTSTFGSPWRSLPVPPAEWDEGLKSKFRANLRNREKRLRKLGEIRYEVIHEKRRLPQAMDTFYALEAGGWKAERQTAILQQPHVKRFYDTLVERASAEICVPILSLGGKAIAAQFIRVCGDAMFLLKVGYDEDYRTYSPGQLIMARTINYGMGEGLKVLDFLGECMTWKLDWNPRVRPHVQLVLCGPTFSGRHAYWTRYGLKAGVKRVPWLERLARKMRCGGEH